MSTQGFKELQHLIGKRVFIKEAVKVCYKERNADVVGVLTFLGENELLGIPMQATIGRLPITLSSLKQISLVD